MADIAPFRGLRYDPALAGGMAAVITPPYDVIDSAAQEKFYQSSPYNIIRLEYGRTYTGDDREDNRYTRAASTLRRWRDEKVLKQDRDQAFYLYRQSFRYRGRNHSRTGVLTALKLEPYAKRAVLPHEATLSKPKEDRLELLRHCRANFSPIFTLFSDKDGAVEELLGSLCTGHPACDFSGSDGQHHTMWIVENPSQQKLLQEKLADRTLFIADGHHRYETALAYSTESSSGHRVLAALFSLHSPDLVVLPTHRILSGLTPEQHHRLQAVVETSFHITPRALPPAEDWQSFREELAAAGSREPVLGMLLPGGLSLLTLKSPAPRGERPLEVTLLRDLIFTPLLGSDTAVLEQAVSYTREEEEARRAVSAGQAAAAFLLNPTPAGEVAARALMGERLPQKTTYFYPKLPSGLVIHTLDD